MGDGKPPAAPFHPWLIGRNQRCHAGMDAAGCALTGSVREQGEPTELPDRQTG
jgi:hypothetical protein